MRRNSEIEAVYDRESVLHVSVPTQNCYELGIDLIKALPLMKVV
jgi:hypothetical protein